MKIEIKEKKKDKRVSVTFYTEVEIKEKLRKFAKEKNATSSYIINAILEEVLKEEEK